MKLKKILKRGGIGLLVLVVAYVLEQHAFPYFFNKKLLEILISINIIYYVSFLCILNSGVLVYLLIRIRMLSKTRRKELYIGFSDVTEEELNTPLKDEHRAMLEYLIQQDGYSAYRNKLWEFLEEPPPTFRDELEFSINLKEMQRLGYITQSPSQWGMIVTITDKACEKLSNSNK